MVGVSIGEKLFIEGGIAQDLRSDGRKRLTYRPISLQTGVIPQANGSARVKLGGTDVIASVKAELGRPTHLYPDRGSVSIYVDCSPTVAPLFEALFFCNSPLESRYWILQDYFLTTWKGEAGARRDSEASILLGIL